MTVSQTPFSRNDHLLVNIGEVSIDSIFYPNIGYSYVEQYDFYYMTRSVMEAYISA
jgi:hypothetical protein